MKFIIFICLSSFIFYAKCGLLGGLKLDLSNENAVKNIAGTLNKQTKGIVEDLGDLLGPSKNDDDQSKNNEPVEENDEKDVKRQDTTTQRVTSPANQDENKKQTTEQAKPKKDTAITNEMNKKEDIEETSTESLISKSTPAKEPTVTEKNKTK